MRVRIDEIKTHPGRYTCPENKTVHACVGTALNKVEVLARGVVPASFLRRWVGTEIVRDDEWIVQGQRPGPVDGQSRGLSITERPGSKDPGLSY